MFLVWGLRVPMKFKEKHNGAGVYSGGGWGRGFLKHSSQETRRFGWQEANISSSFFLLLIPPTL